MRARWRDERSRIEGPGRDHQHLPGAETMLPLLRISMARMSMKADVRQESSFSHSEAAGTGKAENFCNDVPHDRLH
jgi:hypothetical protein